MGKVLRRNPSELKTLILHFKRVITLGSDVDEISKQSYFFLSRERKGLVLARLQWEGMTLSLIASHFPLRVATATSLTFNRKNNNKKRKQTNEQTNSAA